MEDILNIIDSAMLNNRVADYPTAFSGNWFLFGLAMFVDLLMSLVALVTIYNTSKSLSVTRKYTQRTEPINAYKWMLVFVCMALFLRSSMDAALLLTWGEVPFYTLMYMNNIDRVMDALATIPFLAFIYLILRAGPVIEFQLLRKPIPTDLHPTWRMLRKPLLSFLTIVLLCTVITITK